MGTGSGPGGLARFLDVRRHHRSVLEAGFCRRFLLPQPLAALLERRKNTAIAIRHLATRQTAIRAELARATPGFVFLAGNSHAELLGCPDLGGAPVVNGGIGGASARSYAAQLDRLPFTARAGTAVLWVGSNDILRRASPLSPHTAEGFEAAVIRIVTWLRARADVVLIAAVSPIAATADDREPAAVIGYSARLQRIAVAHGCGFFDPFAGFRAGDTGLARPDTLRADGVHLVDYSEIEDALRAMMGQGRATYAAVDGIAVD